MSSVTFSEKLPKFLAKQLTVEKLEISKVLYAMLLPYHWYIARPKLEVLHLCIGLPAQNVIVLIEQ